MAIWYVKSRICQWCWITVVIVSCFVWCCFFNWKWKSKTIQMDLQSVFCLIFNGVMWYQKLGHWHWKFFWSNVSNKNSWTQSWWLLSHCIIVCMVLGARTFLFSDQNAYSIEMYFEHTNINKEDFEFIVKKECKCAAFYIHLIATPKKTNEPVFTLSVSKHEQ